MSDTCPTCQHDRLCHDGNTPGCIECDCHDLWGDGGFFVYSGLSELVKRIDRDRLALVIERAILGRMMSAPATSRFAADAVLDELPELMGGGEQK